MKIKYLIIIAILSVVACKKSKITPAPAPAPTPVNPVVPTRQELTKDSIFLYAKQIYLWNDALPSYEIFNPRKYTSGSTDLANYNAELFDITKYSTPYEYKSGYTSSKYSYIFNKSNKNPSAYIPAISAVDLEGNGNDLGVKLGLYAYFGFDSQNNTGNYAVCIQAVYQNSPADKAGLVRGDRITKMNGTAIGSNYNAEIGLINSFFTATTMTLEGLKANGTSFNVTLNKATYKSSPIYHTKIFTSGAKKIGYLAYARFSNLTNSQSEFDVAFANFASEGVTDLIVDLRYNGGGYVNTAQYLLNLIAPSSASGSVMFAEHFNTTMQTGKATILSNQPLLDASGKVQYSNGRIITYADVNYSVSDNTERFVKKGSLNNVANVVFLVSGSTASASELLINSLKPFVKVTLIGEVTYGKPVGFFPITLENKYDVYFSMFETKNSRGEGGYFDGFTPDYTMKEFITPTSTTTPLYNFGDPAERYTEKALSVLAPGITGFSNTSTINSNTKVLSVGPSQNLNSLLTPGKAPMPALPNGNEFVGMIETRHKLK